MDVKEIIESGLNVSITLSAKDLQEVINYTIISTRREMERAIVEEKTEVYLSPKQVSKMLNVAECTLWRWNKCGYLIPIEIGGKRRYRKSVINAMLNRGIKQLII